ncbi:unnamed protein product [Calypogeia fissa]
MASDDSVTENRKASEHPFDCNKDAKLLEDQERMETAPEISDSGTLLPLMVFPAAHELPPRPPPANECNFTHYYALDVGKEFHDQYIFRHANGLCVVGLAPTHAAFKATVGITGVDFNVGKSSRADMKAVGKRKKNATVLEGNSVLCKVMTGEMFFLIRCCVRGTLLEVNQRLIQNPQLLVSHADTQGYVAVLMPRSEDWAKAEKSLLTPEDYRAQRGLQL